MTEAQAKVVLGWMLALAVIPMMLMAFTFLVPVTFAVICLMPWVYSTDIKNFIKSLFKR